MKRITLTELCKRYCDSRINLKPGSAEQIAYSVRSVEKHVGRTVYADEFSEAGMLRFLKARTKQVSLSTVKRERGDLLTLWRFAHKRGWAPVVADVETVRVPPKNPTAWTVEEIGALLSFTMHLRGTMRHLPIPRSEWYTSLILFLYDTGCRIGAALSLSPADVNLDDAYALLEAENSKTGIVQTVPLSEQTVEWLRKHFDPDRELVWPYPWNKRRLHLDIKELADAADIPCATGEGFHKFRRTHATMAVNAVGWQAAQANLGHTSESMTRRYVDQRQLERKIIPLPRPKMEGGAA